METESKTTSEPAKQIKNYEFCRRIKNKDKGPDNTSNNIDENKTPKDDSQIILSFNLILNEEGISFKVKEVKDNLNENSSFYEKTFSFEDFKEINKIFEFYKNLSTIFDSLKCHFEKNKDIILLEEDNIIIKIKINLDIFEETINLVIPLIKKTNEDNIKNLLDSVFYLNKEKITLNEEITNLKEKENNLNEEVSMLKKELTEISKYVREKLTPNEDQDKILKSYEVVREIKKSSQNEESFEQNEIQDEIRNTSTPCPEDLDVFTISLKILLYKEKIKIYINEIQDDLKTNYLEYESIFTKEYFDKYKIKFNSGLEEIYDFLCNLFEEQKDHPEKDGENKIIINLIFPVALEDETITLEINKKGLSLEKSLNNLTKTVQILNKENKSLKDELNNLRTRQESDISEIKIDSENKERDFLRENKSLKDEINNLKSKQNNDINGLKNEAEMKEKEFQKRILLKVYPIGSYYWSNNSTNPGELFGGQWTEINGRFLFATKSGYSCGQTGGEEKHTLTINEMPSHSHSTVDWARTNHGSWSHNSSGSNRTLDYRDDTPYSGTYSTGGGAAHNNMPPYLCAYCWRRYG